MDDNSLDIILRLTDELTPALAKAQQALRDAAAQVTGATTPASNAVSNLNKACADWFATITGGVTVGNLLSDAIEKALDLAIKAAEALPELALQGARVDDVAEAYGRLTTQAGHLSSTLLETLRQGTHGTIDDFTLMQRANKDLAAGLNLTDEQFSLLSQGAFALAQATGGSVKDALDTMSDALVTGRAKAVALLTGKIDLKAAEEAYAERLGTTADELTAESKLEADREAILQRVGVAVDRLGPQMDGLDEKVDQARANWTNFTNELGRVIATSPTLTGAIDGIRQILIDTFGGSRQEAIHKIATLIDDATVAAVGFGADAVQVGGMVAEGWHALAIVIDTIENGVYGLEAGLIQLNISAMKARAFVEPWNDYSGAIADAETHLVQVQKAIVDNDTAIAGHEKAEGEWAAASQQLADKVEALKLKLQQARDATTNFVGPINDETAAHTAAGNAADAHGAAVQTAASVIKKFSEAWAELRSMGDSYLETVHAMDPALEQLIEQYLRAGASVKTLAAAFPQLTSAQIEAVKTFVTANDAMTAELEKVTIDYYRSVNAASHDSVQRQIDDAYLAAAARIAAMEKAKTYSIEAEMVIWKTAEQTANNIIQKTLESDLHSKAHFEKVAIDAKNAYDFAQAHADQFSSDWIQHLREAADDAQVAVDQWGTGFETNAKRATHAIDSVVDAQKRAAEAIASFSLLGAPTPVGDQGKLTPDQMIAAGYVNPITHELTQAGQFAGYSLSGRPTALAPKHFAGGGRPTPGVPSWIGELGPELWVPDSAGTVIPNAAAATGGGTQTIQLVVDGRVLASLVNDHNTRTTRQLRQLPAS